MLHNENLPLWALSVGVVVPLVAVVAACVCGCKKTVPKNELLGLAGMVKITNPEECLNHNRPSNESSTCAVAGSGRACVEAAETNRRTSSTVNRSLPAIPNDPERLHLEGGDPIWENEPNGDTSSELYATVEENKQVVQPLALGLDVAGASKRAPSINSQPEDGKNSNADGFNLYARLKAEHPYDKLKKSEHPYAQVRSTNQSIGESSLNEQGPSGVILRSDEGSGVVSSSNENLPSYNNPVPPPRTRRSASHNSLSAAASTQLPSSVADIAAATAIAGHISANQELPYMTPPIPSSTNFSGDSQDSKGYTSISVREPLANIKAQTKTNQRSRAQELMDSHYATVSDDSDEMYAAIEEPSQVYTSGSETYAQIQPSIVAEPTSEPALSTDTYHFPPQPPSVDSLKHVAQAHSRQASSSSATSSVANLGSPKPEKRQANSPLPPPPAGSPDMHVGMDKKCSLVQHENIGEVNLDEMYAKVMKKKQRNFDIEPSDDSLKVDASNNLAQTSGDNLSHISIETSSSRECLFLKTKKDTDRTSICSIDLAQDVKINNSSHDTSPFQSSGDICSVYEKVHDSDIKQSDLQTSDTGYESLGMHNSLGLKYDPGYEVVAQLQCNPSDCDPNYEELRPQHTTTSTGNAVSIPCSVNIGEDDNDISILPIDKSNSSVLCSSAKPNVNRTCSNSDPGYERVDSNAVSNCNKTELASDCNDEMNVSMAVFCDDSSEPNYESMPSEGPEHNYAGVLGIPGGSESDPNYEMVEHEDPNYESVNYIEVNADPPYERLCNEVRDSDNDTIPGYEQVRHAGNNFVLQQECTNVASMEEMQNTQQIQESGYEEVGRKQEHSTIDVWKNSAHNIASTASVPLVEVTLKSGDSHNVADKTDVLYSQVQKTHTKM